MEAYDYGPLQTFEVTWKSGHVETIQGHQVTFDSGTSSFSGWGDISTRTQCTPRFTIHGMFGSHWRLMLTAQEDDLMSLRNVTVVETIAGQE